MIRSLSPKQAFEAMSIFLERYYDRTGRHGEVEALLGDIQIHPGDGHPADPAMWNDWLAAIECVQAAAASRDE